MGGNWNAHAHISLHESRVYISIVSPECHQNLRGFAESRFPGVPCFTLCNMLKSRKLNDLIKIGGVGRRPPGVFKMSKSVGWKAAAFAGILAGVILFRFYLHHQYPMDFFQN